MTEKSGIVGQLDLPRGRWPEKEEEDTGMDESK